MTDGVMVDTEHDGAPEDSWTPARRQVLAAVLEHLLPWSGGLATGMESAAKAEAVEAVSRVVIHTLSGPPFESRAPWVLATLDELESLAQALDADPLETPPVDGFSSLDSGERETTLRQVEGGGNPYLVGGLRLLLQLALEAYFGDPSRGGNPRGEAWEGLGLTRQGLRRRLSGAEP